MSFWYKERQKMALWWNGISRQEIRSYVYTAVLFLFLTFLYFLSIHISGLFTWYRFQRSMVECFIMLFLTQLMTGKNMLHPFWRIGYIPFALWITIFRTVSFTPPTAPFTSTSIISPHTFLLPSACSCSSFS